MKTYNIEYINKESFDSFITLNQDILRASSVLIQIFAGVLNRSLLEEVSHHIAIKIPQGKIIGATTDGEILHGSVLTHSIVVSITLFEKTTLTLGSIENIDLEDSFSVGERLALKIKEPNSKLFILFGDGLSMNGEDFINGILKETPGVLVAGGLAGDNGIFSKTYLIYQNRVITNGVVGVALNSDQLMINNQYSFAWENIGREFTVGRSEKNRVYEIDNITPVALYTKYLGTTIANLLPSIGIEFPLIIQENGIEVARAVLSRNSDGSLVFAGNIPEGSKVRFGVGNVQHILDDTKNIAQKIAQKSSESIFVYSCMARRRFLGEYASEDIHYLSKISPLSGFFTYGEFYSFGDSCKFLNESMTVISLSENNNPIQELQIESNKKGVNYMTTLQALSHLANSTSRELDQLNKSLHQKVVGEIEKNLEYEKKVFDSMKMASLGDMIANIAHQWRQPLSVITTSASAMQLNKDLGILDDDLFGKYTEMIISQAMYLSETINTFRDFIKEEHKLCDVVIQSEIDNTLKILDVVLKDNGIILTKNINYEKPIVLRLVTGELSQVIINIINNAKDALCEESKGDKWIRLELGSNETHCIITVEDNGKGIPEDVLPRIFDQNFTTKSSSIGTGIGLYMSYNIVVKHFGGSLYAKNSHNGAKFFIEIPFDTI